MRLALMTATALLLFGTASAADAPPKPVALEAGLAGRWTGVLQYRDYQSHGLVSLPVKTELRALPDAATVLDISAFDDGPKTGTVTITSIRLFDPKSDTVRSAGFRRGDTPEIETETTSVAHYIDPLHWTLVYAHTGTDDDKPADIRTTETRDGAVLTAIEEYRPVADHVGGWKFRNQTRLTQDAP